jgi:hypothetical protein
MLWNNIGNVYDEIRFRKHPLICPVKNCYCAFYSFDRYLFNKALGNTNPSMLSSNADRMMLLFSQNMNENLWSWESSLSKYLPAPYRVAKGIKDRLFG